ncbi:hypothetical protein Q3V23_09015 [Streptomyces sp. VNUA116]|uniref:hypothetical protein n=1 Tax=Streptomyces sp. VNUA116 TaxID=3062449 RepID=UPI00267641F2|nr:hypothetical protein [Streptomyces sp. VNUA116]WKU44211.1 hypothetical protein Q3V23_09015 [Streptomyces sp. VNUA116]
MSDAMTPADPALPATPPDPEPGAAEGTEGADGLPGPQPLGVARTPAGDPAVDAQLVRLADADHLAVSGHLEVYEDVHRGLRDALSALDRGPGPSGTPAAPGAPASYDNRS